MRQAILVLGMHRSGTSAVAGAIRHLGVDFGDSLMPGREGENPRGYFEHLGVVEANEAVLQEARSTWDDPFGLSASWFESDAAREHGERIARILGDVFRESLFWGIKDPRLCRLLPLWLPQIERQGVRPCFLHVSRPVDEVADSLARRNGFSREKSALLWVDHVVRAEHSTRGLPRAFVSYESLLRDPGHVLESAGERMGVEWPVAPGQASGPLRDFVSRGLRHHVAESAADLPDLGRVDSVARALERLLAEFETGETAASTGQFDRRRRDLDAILADIDPVLREHMAQLTIAPDFVVDLQRQVAERTEWIRSQGSDISVLQARVSELSHDLEETREFPRVVVIEDGRVVQDGPPAQLEADEQGLYSTMLACERRVHAQLWQRADWRRMTIDGGVLLERDPDPKPATSGGSRS